MLIYPCMKTPEILAALALQRVSKIYVSDVVATIHFESGEQINIDARGDGSSHIDVRLYKPGVQPIVDLVGVNLPGPFEAVADGWNAPEVVENSDFPFSDWQYEVANGDTRLGYADWLEGRLESQRHDDEMTSADSQK